MTPMRQNSVHHNFTRQISQKQKILMKFNFLITLLFISNFVNAQPQSLEDRIHGISTLILSAAPGVSSKGTGFFFQKLGERTGPKDSASWVVIENLYLVTNRHVVLLKDKRGKEYLPEIFTFHLRKVVADSIMWAPITLSKAEIIKRLKIHPNPMIDVAIIDILDLVLENLKKDRNIIPWSSVTEDDFAGKNMINVEATDEIIAIGYPRGFYDEYNVFPVVKSGTLASRWGARFNNNPYFIIDIKLFPGSSGSIVISKPTYSVLNQGQAYFNPDKQFAFLGIYSGEPFKIDPDPPFESDNMVIYKIDKYDLGVVWYAELIPEIIKIGIGFK